MSKPKFTPKPWYISDYGTRQRMAIVDKQLDCYDPRHTIATVCRAKGHEAANAALMVKAPAREADERIRREWVEEQRRAGIGTCAGCEYREAFGILRRLLKWNALRMHAMAPLAKLDEICEDAQRLVKRTGEEAVP